MPLIRTIQLAIGATKSLKIYAKKPFSRVGEVAFKSVTSYIPPVIAHYIMLLLSEKVFTNVTLLYVTITEHCCNFVTFSYCNPVTPQPCHFHTIHVPWLISDKFCHFRRCANPSISPQKRVRLRLLRQRVPGKRRGGATQARYVTVPQETNMDQDWHFWIGTLTSQDPTRKFL